MDFDMKAVIRIAAENAVVREQRDELAELLRGLVEQSDAQRKVGDTHATFRFIEMDRCSHALSRLG